MSQTKNILIKVNNDQICLNEYLSIPLSETNLPYGEFKFVESREIYYEVEMISYDKLDATLVIRIVNYKPTNLGGFSLQKPKSEIKKLCIVDIYWLTFNVDLSFYKKASFIPLLTENRPSDISSEDKLIKLNVKVPFSKTSFGMGYIEWKQKLYWESQLVNIRIENPHILPEFEHIKSYFSKHFNSRTFDVQLVINKTDGATQKISAYSQQIYEIKDYAIETLKFVKTESLRKPSHFIRDLDKSLFTAEDLFDILTKNDLGSFPISNKELFEQIMTWKDVRNKKQLEYLAGSLQHMDGKIRFTLTPKFGFLFYAKGNQLVHYIWEMLNTNATYIWSFDPNIWSNERQLIKMEEVISFIRNHGRDTYLRNVTPHEEVLFKRIQHQGAKSQLVDYFPRWRNFVNESIV